MADDSERFEALLRPVRDGLLRFALQLTRDPVRAEDLLQHSLVRGLQHLGELRADAAFRTWMSRIVWTTFVNEAKRASRDDAVRLTVVEPPPPEPGPDQRLADQRLAERIEQALGGLSEDQARAVWLVDAQGFKYREVAEVLDLPRGTVATLVARGRRRLQQQLRDVALEMGVVR